MSKLDELTIGEVKQILASFGNSFEGRQILKHLKKFIGKQLTVKYQGKSEDGIPRFPVGKGFRESFDK